MVVAISERHALPSQDGTCFGMLIHHMKTMEICISPELFL